MVKILPAMQETQETQVRSLGWEEPWRRAWQPTSVTLPRESHGQRSLAGCSPWGDKELDTTEATSLSPFTLTHWKRKWQPAPLFLPGESRGHGAWWAAVDGVAQSRTRLKRLSSSNDFFYKLCYLSPTLKKKSLLSSGTLELFSLLP